MLSAVATSESDGGDGDKEVDLNSHLSWEERALARPLFAVGKVSSVSLLIEAATSCLTPRAWAVAERVIGLSISKKVWFVAGLVRLGPLKVESSFNQPPIRIRRTAGSGSGLLEVSARELSSLPALILRAVEGVEVEDRVLGGILGQIDLSNESRRTRCY